MENDNKDESIEDIDTIDESLTEEWTSPEVTLEFVLADIIKDIEASAKALAKHKKELNKAIDEHKY